MNSEPLSTANVTNTPVQSSKRECKMANSTKGRSGKMSVPSTQQLLEEALTASLQVSRVNHSLWQGNELALKMNATYSQTSSASQKKLASLCSSSKTFLDCSPRRKTQQPPSQTLLGSWPKQGLMLSGVVYQPVKLAPRTNEKDSSASPGEPWLTPNVMDKLNPRSKESLETYQQRNRPGRTSCPTLREQVVYGKNWSTPVKMDHNEPWKLNPKAHSTSVIKEIHLWSTPLRTDSKFCLSTGKFTNIVADVQSHSDGSYTNRLNPAWAETLMGWPAGWTSTASDTKLSFSGFPKGQGDSQHDHEPPRTIHKDDCTDRAKRIAMVGNGVVPQQVTLAYRHLLGVAAAKPQVLEEAAA